MKKVYLDSDFLVGFVSKQDAHHEVSKNLLTFFNTRNTHLYTSTAVVGETTTVLSHKLGPIAVTYFLSLISAFPITHPTQTHHLQALEIMKNQSKKGMSYVDCLNIVLVREDKAAILSYDSFYFTNNINLSDAKDLFSE